MFRNIIITSVCTLLTVGSPALGQGKRAADWSKDQHYEFEDDPLAGVGPNDRGQHIRIRPNAGRATLIRPRTHFIPELTRTVENL